MFNWVIPSQWIAYLRALAFLIGLIIGPGIPGVQPAPVEKPPPPVQGIVSAALMAGALATKAGDKNTEKKR